jgi:uncharacterized small protein (DUF1192 family)
LVACEPYAGKTVRERGELPFAISSFNSLGEDGIELSTLHVQVATMEQELQAVHELEEGKAALREELERMRGQCPVVSIGLQLFI